MYQVHHKGQVWERDNRTNEEIDAELRELADSTLARYAGELDLAFTSGLSYESWPAEQRRAMRAQNEVYRRQHERSRQQEKAAEEARIQGLHDAEATAYKESFKARAEAAFPGTKAEFERQWDAIWAEHQRQETLSRLNDNLLERKRAQMSF
jgi:hypothetical protein